MRLIKRDIFDDILEWLDDKRIILVKGARRTGKTTLLSQLRTWLDSRGSRTVMFSADQELGSPFFQNAKVFFKFLSGQYMRTDEKIYCFIDECQYLPDAALFLKTLYDISQDRIKFIVTGSSSLDLLRVKEPLTGRKIEFILERFSLREFLRAASEYSYEDEFRIPRDFEALKEFYDIYSKDLEYYFLEYVNWGGYPEVCLEKNIRRKKGLLREIVTTYVEKDISQFFRIENVSKFNNLVRVLCRQISQLLNKSEISGTLGIHFNTLERYLDILEGTYIVTLVRPFYTNIRKELSRMPKVFVNDFGIIRYFTGMEYADFESIDGQHVEDFVFTQLRLRNNPDLFFYRTVSKAEIDFILKQESRLIPVEVKFRKKPAVPVIMKHFFSNYPGDTDFGIVFSRNLMERKDRVYFMPALLAGFVTF